jgi:branched-chain amino acid transport system substrate-binding protein
MKRTTKLAIAIALVCAQGAAHAQTIKIGVNQPLTGAFAASGNFVVGGARIAADEINAKGGVLGKKIELVIEDNKSNPTEAAAVAEKLITSDKTPVLMGAWGSNLTLAVMPKLVEYAIPMIVETSSAAKITTQGNPYVFRISAPAAVEADALGKLVGKLGIKKADFLAINNDWGRNTVDEFGKMFGNNGAQVGTVQFMDQSAQDMSSQLAKLKDTDADTLIVTAAVDQLTLIFKQAAALGMKKQIITTGGAQNPDQLIQQAGAAANGTMHLATFVPWFPEKTPNPEGTKYLAGEWQKRGFTPAGVAEGFRGYDGIRTAVAGIEKAGTTEPAAITKALWQVKIQGLNGDISFEKVGPAGRESGQSTPRVFLLQIADGKITVPAL